MTYDEAQKKVKELVDPTGEKLYTPERAYYVGVRDALRPSEKNRTASEFVVMPEYKMGYADYEDERF